MTNTITKNAYRMLALAVMTLLMAVNLSQTADARPSASECINMYSDYADSDGINHTTQSPTTIIENVCDGSWNIKYFGKKNPYKPYERVLGPGETFIIDTAKLGGFKADGCPSPSDMSDFDSYYAELHSSGLGFSKCLPANSTTTANTQDANETNQNKSESKVASGCVVHENNEFRNTCDASVFVTAYYEHLPDIPHSFPLYRKGDTSKDPYPDAHATWATCYGDLAPI